MALLKIIFACLVAAVVIWFTIYFYGSHQGFIAYDHPLIKEQGPWVMAYGGKSEAFQSHSLEALKAAAQDPKLWLAVDVYMSSERSFYLIPQGYRDPQDKRPWVQRKNSEIENINIDKQNDTHFIKIEEAITSFPTTKFFFWFRDNERDMDLILAALLKKFPGLENRALIYSEFDVVMKSVKEQLPRWVYGTPDAERTRFLMFDAFGLQGAATLRADFYFSPLRIGNVRMISQSLRQEVERRLMPFIIGPLNTEAEMREAIQLSPRGYLTNNTTKLFEILSQ